MKYKITVSDLRSFEYCSVSWHLSHTEMGDLDSKVARKQLFELKHKKSLNEQEKRFVKYYRKSLDMNRAASRGNYFHFLFDVKGVIKIIIFIIVVVLIIWVILVILGLF